MSSTSELRNPKEIKLSLPIRNRTPDEGSSKTVLITMQSMCMYRSYLFYWVRLVVPARLWRILFVNIGMIALKNDIAQSFFTFVTNRNPWMNWWIGHLKFGVSCIMTQHCHCHEDISCLEYIVFLSTLYWDHIGVVGDWEHKLCWFSKNVQPQTMRSSMTLATMRKMIGSN